MVRNIVSVLVAMAWASTAFAQEASREFSWSDMKKAGRLTVGEIQPGGPAGAKEQLKIDNPCSNPWWTDQAGGWIGGIGGSLCGLLGGLIGTLAGMGKARRFVLALTTALVVLGAVALVVGVIAWLLGQPYGVYYPLLLGGIILTAVCGGNLPGLRRRYEQIELRKMEAMDAG